MRPGTDIRVGCRLDRALRADVDDHARDRGRAGVVVERVHGVATGSQRLSPKASAGRRSRRSRRSTRARGPVCELDLVGSDRRRLVVDLEDPPTRVAAAVAGRPGRCMAEAALSQVVVELAEQRGLLERVERGRRRHCHLTGGEQRLRLAFDTHLDRGCRSSLRQNDENDEQENEALGHDSSFREGIDMGRPAGLLTRGTPSAAFPGISPSGVRRRASPLTAAGPSRNCTGFPHHSPVCGANLPSAECSLRWMPVLVWAAVIFAFSSIPSLSTHLGTWDLVLRKAAHLTEYAILAVLARRATGSSAVGVRARRRLRSDRRVPPDVRPRPPRPPVDVGIDAVGVLLGLMAWRRVADLR